MSDREAGPLPSQGPGSFQNGVWLSKAEGSRNEKYQKWSDDRVKSTVHSLDKQKHSSLVRLSGECLQVRSELRGLQKERHHYTSGQHATATPDTGIGPGSPTEAISSPGLSRKAPTLNPSSSTPSLSSLTITNSATSATGGISIGRSLRKGPGSTPIYSSTSTSMISSSASVAKKDSRVGGVPETGRGTEGPVARAKGAGSLAGRARVELTPDVSAMKLKKLHSSRSLSKLNNNMDINH